MNANISKEKLWNFVFIRVYSRTKVTWGAGVFKNDSALLGIELDTYWAMRGGKDPVVLLRQYGERVRLIHQKDYPAEQKYFSRNILVSILKREL